MYNTLKKKKLISTLIMLIMVLSAFVVISSTASASASGTVTYYPTTYGLSLGPSPALNVPLTTAVYASGGVFSSLATVYFYLSSTPSTAGLLTYGASGPYYAIAVTYLTSASPTALAQNVTFFSGEDVIEGVSGNPSVAAIAITSGTYYILASDSSPYQVTTSLSSSSFAVPSTSVQFVPQTAVISISPTTVTVGSTVKVTGSGWDPAATINVYLNSLQGTLLFTTTTNAVGGFTYTYTIPALSGTESWNGAAGVAFSPVIPPYKLVGFETNALSATYPEGGITAFTTFNVVPTITAVPGSTQGAVGATFTITGSGFVAGEVITGFTATSTGTSGITIGTVNTYYSTVTVAPDGAFTVTVTLATAVPISLVGTGLTVVITLTTPAATDTFYDVIYYSVPGVQPELFLKDLVTDTNMGEPGDALQITVSGFPASSTIDIYFDNVVLTVTTDVNGYSVTKTVVPNIPAVYDYGALYHYTVFAECQGITAHAYFEVYASVYFTDSSGATLAGEYAATGSVVTVSAVGLGAYAESDVTDSGFIYGSLGYAYSIGYPVTITNGSYDPSTMMFAANANGDLTLSYALYYDGLTATTGTNCTIELTVTATTTYYYKVGYAVTSLTPYDYAPGATVAKNVSNLIPTGALITPETASYVGPYSVYIDTTLITLKTPSANTTFSGITIKSTRNAYADISFVIPSSISTGLHTFSVDSKKSMVLFSDYQFIVSTPSTTSTGTVTVCTPDSVVLSGTGTLSDPFMMYLDDFQSSDYWSYYIQFVLYNFPAGASVKLLYYTNYGEYQYGSAFTTDSNGATVCTFYSPNYGVGSVPYLIVFNASAASKYVTITGANWYYELAPAVAFDPPSYGDNGGMPITDYYTYYGYDAYAGSDIYFYANSLPPNTAYNVYLSTSASFTTSEYLMTFTTWGSGDISFYSGSEYTLQLPSLMQSGTYYLDFAPATSSATSTPLYLTVEVSGNQVFAFPGQFVPFSWWISYYSYTIPYAGYIYDEANFYWYSPVTVTVFLNGTAYTSFYANTTFNDDQAYLTLNGSFLAPNAAPGSWWYVSYMWSQVNVNTSYFGSHYLYGYSWEYEDSYAYDTPAYLGLVEGNGALFTGVTAGQIAELSAAVNSSVTASMKVPLSELSANITLLSGDIVTIMTAFGTMTATLQAINATVNSINGTVVMLSTDLGKVMTNITNLNAEIMAISGATVTLETDVGIVNTTLNSLAPVILGINGTVASIDTLLGTVNMNLTTFSNAILTAINGNTATITALNTTFTAELSALDAHIAAVNGTVAYINTTLGTVTASLVSIGATVSGIKGNTATIITDLGTLTGTVTSINGTVATINTKLGTLTTTVNTINTTTHSTSSSVGNTMIFEIVVLVLILVTLALVAYVIGQMRKLMPPKPPEEIKAPEEEKPPTPPPETPVPPP